MSQGRNGQGRNGQGRNGQGRNGQGRNGQGPTRWRFELIFRADIEKGNVKGWRMDLVNSGSSMRLSLG